ncbi:craniofacial development protein 2-like [Gordionus sp. m RMFG-2023]|uniref:craniofacial development protein 2-like n=1 Tax=Gordionus sp. m RMFG-2023 TaxID=3053472 RepID=UPI0031FCDB88
MAEEKMDIIAILETHSKDNNMANFSNFIYSSGTTLNSWSGIAFLISKRVHKFVDKFVDKFVPISERCGLLYLNTWFKRTILINVYAPPHRRDRLSFLDDLENIVCSLPRSRNLIILGDLNIKIGKEESFITVGVIGNAAIPQPNGEDSRKLLDLCKSLNLKIENTFFLHSERNTLTYRRNNITSQIDFFISNIHGWFTDVRALLNINISDHKLVRGSITIRNLWGNSRRLAISNQPSPPPWIIKARNLQCSEVKLLLVQNLRARMALNHGSSESESME